MKKFLHKAAALFLSVMLTAGVPCANVYAADLLYKNDDVQKIAQGVTYTKSSRLYRAGWMDIYILEMNASDANVVPVVLENTEGYGLKATVDTLAKQNGVIAAVNGDFFGSGNPKSSMGQVADKGEMKAAQNYYNGSENRYAGFFIDNEGVPFIDYVKTTMGFYCGDTAAFTLGAKNKVTDFSNPVYFDRKAISDTSSLDGNFNNLTKIVVADGKITYISSPGETVNVPENGYIIVMNNATRNEKISWYSVGMAVRYDESEKFVFRPDKSISSISFGISGGGELLRNGETVNQGLIIGEYVRNPRTMVGINKDKTKIYIVCIDGRLNGIGATHTEAANIMRDIGAWDAIHFDGGGSTTMAVQQEDHTQTSIVNTPSEGSMRAVANGIGIKTTGESGVLSYIKAYVEKSSKDGFLFKDMGNTICVNAYDMQTKAMDIDTSQLRYSSSVAGTWDGNVFYPTEEGTGTITVSYGDYSSTIDIKVMKGINGLSVTANNTTLDVGQSTQLNAKLLNKDGFSLETDISKIVWTTDNSSVGVVQDGMFIACSEGECTVTGTYNNVSDTVKIGVGKKTVAVDSFEESRDQILYQFPEDSGITGSSNTINGVAIDGKSSISLNYRFVPNLTTTQCFYTGFGNSPITLPNGISDIVLWYRGDGSKNILKAVLRDSNGNQQNVLISDDLTNTGWQEAVVPIPQELSGTITFDKVYVAALNTDSNVSGCVFIDNLKARVPAFTGSDSNNNYNDYMNRSLDNMDKNAYETIAVFGQTASYNGDRAAQTSKVLTQMSAGARAMAFAGPTAISNSTGVAAVEWDNTYNTTSTDIFSFIRLATGSGNLRNANPDQWTALQNYINYSSMKNIIVTMDRNVWGSYDAGLTDKKEAEALHKIFRDAALKLDKNIIVVSSVGVSNYTIIKDGVRYINLAGLSGQPMQYLKVMGNSEEMYYEYINVN